MRFAAAYAWKVASLIHMGIMQSRYEGSFSSAPSRRFVRLTFTNRQLIFVKHWRNQQQVRCGLDGGFAAACSKMLACRRRLHGANSKGGVETPVYRRIVRIRTRAPS
jgi:hypothetical protein